MRPFQFAALMMMAMSFRSLWAGYPTDSFVATAVVWLLVVADVYCYLTEDK